MNIDGIGRHFILSALACTAFLSAAQAAPQKETYRDWSASLDEVNTGEDLRKTCVAATSAGDAQNKTWGLTLSISNGDVLPPDAYPQVAITADGLPKGEGIPLVLDFGGKRIDAKGMGDGKQLMIDNMRETSLQVLRAMAAGDKLNLTIAGKPAPALSLAGFTASYRKLGSWCGFLTSDVAK